MEKETREKLVKSYEGRLKATKERHQAELERVKSRQVREVAALEQQYRAMLKSKPSQFDPEKIN